MSRFAFHLFIFAWLLGFVAPALGDDNKSVAIRIEPTEIIPGGVAVLSVSINGVSAADVSIPPVEGLRIEYAGQQSSYTVVNGDSNRGVTIFYHVQAEREGEYTIPPVQIIDGGQEYHSESAQLRVIETMPVDPNATPAPAPQPQPQPRQFQRQPQRQPQRQAQQQAQPSDESAANSNGEPIFVRLSSSKKTVYVGELVPIQIKLYVRGDSPAKLRSMPALAGDAFTMNKLAPEPLQKVETIDGMQYQTATWNTALSAVKSGDYPVAAQVDLAVLERQQMGHGGVFDDPFFAMFTSRAKYVDRTVSNPEESWRVLPLPTEGKPASFNGAIGEFKVTAQADPDKVTVGDPVTLRYTVDGVGNFSSVLAPKLENVDGWKTYPATGKTDLADEYGVTGKKVFEEAAIPQRIGLPMPKALFTWFSPEAKQYVVREIAPQQVAIADAPPGSSPVSAPRPAPTVNKSGDEETKKDSSGLVSNKVEMGSFYADLKPHVFNPWLILSQTAALSALILGLVVARRRHLLENDPEYAHAIKTDRRLREALDAMRQAVAAQNAPLFFTQARTAFQVRLASKWKLKPEAITYQFIEARSPATARAVESVFHMADELSYSGHSTSTISLAHWDQNVRTELANLEHLA